MSPESPQPATCRAGCAQVKITPPLGVSLAGYFHDRVAASVRDDLHARAVVLESRGARLALVSCDLIAPNAEVTAAARELILDECGIPPECLLVCATHTHTGPAIGALGAVARDEGYVASLPRRIADAVVAASGNTFEATLRPNRALAEGLSFNRLFRQRDGSEVFGRRDSEVACAGPIDPELQTLSLVDEIGTLRALLVHFALHVDVIGGGTADFISADWPGEMARAVSAVYGPEVVTLLLQGTCGDVNHHPHQPSRVQRSRDDKAVQIGRALAGAAMYAAERAEPMGDVPLAASVRELSIPYYTRDDAFRAEIAALKAQPDPSDFDQYLVERGEAWPHDGQVAVAPLQAMRIGDIGLVGLPAEIFARIGLEIKQFSPAPYTFVVELANASVSTYVPTADQAERGAYGARPILSRWLCADAGRRLADAAQVMLWELWN